MWILLNDCFFSVVDKDCARDEVLVRARRPGDIEKLWPGAKVDRDAGTDYLFRAKVKRDDVKAALAKEVDRVSYANFKDSVADDRLHDAYLRAWGALLAVQPGGLPLFRPREALERVVPDEMPPGINVVGGYGVARAVRSKKKANRRRRK